MKHEIDLSKYNFNTDLAYESIKHNKLNNVKQKERIIGNIKVIDVDIDKENSKLLNKKIGKYTTLFFDDVTDNTNRLELISVLTRYLKKYVKANKDDLILVVGLGNIESTPDSLGPKVIDNITITNHIYELGMLDKKYKRVCSICPGVYAKTGIETSKIIESVVNKIKPSIVIVIDSLASGSIDRLNKTIQITNTGINPGSGIGNKRKEISYDTLHVPVVAIGVPTVVSVNNIVYDVLNNIDYKYNNKKLDSILNNYDLVVTPTEIDYIIECLSVVISKSMNNI